MPPPTVLRVCRFFKRPDDATTNHDHDDDGRTLPDLAFEFKGLWRYWDSIVFFFWKDCCGLACGWCIRRFWIQGLLGCGCWICWAFLSRLDR